MLSLHPLAKEFPGLFIRSKSRKTMEKSVLEGFRTNLTERSFGSRAVFVVLRLHAQEA